MLHVERNVRDRREVSVGNSHITCWRQVGEAKEVGTFFPLPFVFMKPVDTHHKLYLSEATRVSATSMPRIDPRRVA